MLLPAGLIPLNHQRRVCRSSQITFKHENCRERKLSQADICRPWRGAGSRNNALSHQLSVFRQVELWRLEKFAIH